ncbi:MAG: TonB-dependent receptor, partial [Chryseobacterium sp.]
GYGTQSKAKVSGAITTVSAKDVALSPSPNLASGLAGRVPGVVINNRGGEPGNEAVEIFIRGKSTSGDASPLYVIDGIIRDYGALSFIPPNDVESITVLKDASAAIYGSRAANGVILVTTKRGKTGKATISASYNQAFIQPERVPKSADAYTYASMVNAQRAIRNQTPLYTAQDLALYQNGQDPLNHPNTNYADLVLKEWSHQERADLSVSGGNQDVKYYLGAGYLNSGTPFVEGYTYDKQYHFRSNIDAQVTKSLKISLDLSGRLRNNLQSRVDYAHVFLTLPTLNGIYPNGLVGPGRTGNNAILMSRDIDYGYYSQKAGNFTSTLSAEYKIPGVDGLVLSGNFAYDFDNNYTKSWFGVTYYYQLNPATGIYDKMQNSNRASPELGVSSPAGDNITSNVKLTYNKTFAKLHAIDALIGYEQNTTSAYSLSASRQNYASSSLQELFAGDSNPAFQSNSGSSFRTGRQNLFGRLLYTFDERYNLQLQFRYDGSQNFAPGKRYGFFPGISGNWIVSKERFMKNVSWINNLKLRASYGEMGNDKVGAYQYLTSYTYGNNYPFNSLTNQGLSQTNVPNPDITWEVAKTTDVGLDASFFNGRLSASLDYFRTIRSNILARRNASVPAYTGLALPDENIGSTKNEGVEITLGTSAKAGDFRFNVDGNFTYAKNTVIFIDETPSTPEWQTIQGRSIGTPVLYDYIGVFKTQAQLDSYPHLPGTTLGEQIFRDVDGNGIINGNDRIRFPYSTTPRIVYGMNFRIGYKNLDMTLAFQGQAQAYGDKYSVLPFDPIGWGNFPAAQADDAWTPSNPDGNNPGPTGRFNDGSSWRFASQAFLKLKTAEIGYTFSSKILEKAKMKSARIFANGANLFFLHDNYKDINQSPELSNWGWGLSQQRIINLGLNVTF